MNGQLQVDPSKVQAFLITVATSLVAIVSGAATLIGFVRAHDLAGFYNWLQGHDFIIWFTALTTLLSTLYLGARAVWSKWRAIYLAWHARDEVAVVSGKPIAEPAPPPASVFGLLTQPSTVETK